jgi:hypothetical protein
VDPITWEVSDLETEDPGEAHETLELLGRRRASEYPVTAGRSAATINTATALIATPTSKAFLAISVRKSPSPD